VHFEIRYSLFDIQIQPVEPRKYVRMDGNGDIVRVTHAVYERIKY
jgi:hypothetical protein